MAFRSSRLAVVFCLAVVLAAATFAGSVVAQAAGGGGTTRNISAGGTLNFRSAPLGSGVLQSPEVRTSASEAAPAPFDGTVTNRRKTQASRRGDSAVSDLVDRSRPSLVTSFDGLNHRQQRLANGGNQFSTEPPDQGLCVGNGYVMEMTNDVTRVFGTNGSPLTGVVALNTFYGYPAAFQRPAGPFGAFVTDPSCLFDQGTQRWFATVLTLDVNPADGAFLGTNHLDLAVSQTASPTGSWTVYRIAVQDDGTAGTPNHGCSLGPCLGDYPHIGADNNGFYITTNEYSFNGPEYHGAQVYAMSKRALAGGVSSLSVTQLDTHAMVGGNSGFTVWPAVSPLGQAETSMKGTEFFLSSTAADEAHGDGTAGGPGSSTSILTWALTNTQSLDASSPAVSLTFSPVGTNLYGIPPSSDQKAGPVPLVECLNNAACATNLLGAPDPFTEHAQRLDSNDTRMQQVTFAGGRLWGALDTALTIHGVNKAGIAWYVVKPSSTAGGLTAKLKNQGYLGLAGNNLTYPAIGVTPAGNAVMAFTVVGQDYYPSAGYTTLDPATGTGRVSVAAQGVGPQDGFSGTFAYNDPNPPRPRWGDYGAAVPDQKGNVWIASEYIGQSCTLPQYVTAPLGSCGGTRTALANWGTRISSVHVR